jgi:hypothetical protein
LTKLRKLLERLLLHLAQPATALKHGAATTVLEHFHPELIALTTQHDSMPRSFKMIPLQHFGVRSIHLGVPNLRVAEPRAELLQHRLHLEDIHRPLVGFLQNDGIRQYLEDAAEILVRRPMLLFDCSHHNSFQ